MIRLSFQSVNDRGGFLVARRFPDALGQLSLEAKNWLIKWMNKIICLFESSSRLASRVKRIRIKPKPEGFSEANISKFGFGRIWRRKQREYKLEIINCRYLYTILNRSYRAGYWKENWIHRTRFGKGPSIIDCQWTFGICWTARLPQGLNLLFLNWTYHSDRLCLLLEQDFEPANALTVWTFSKRPVS